MAPQTNGSSAIVKARGQRPPRCQCPDGAAGGPAIWTRGPSELRQMAVNVRTFCVRPSSRSPTPWLDVCGPGSSSAGGRSARLCAVSEAPEVTQVAFVHCPSPCAGWVHCPWSLVPSGSVGERLSGPATRPHGQYTRKTSGGHLTRHRPAAHALNP